MSIRDYFDISELVCRHVYSNFGEKSWSFLDKRLLDTILAIREGIGKPITVNNWSSGGSFSQRGLRCNLCSLVKDKTNKTKIYVSAHLQGKAVDFDVKGMSASKVREWIGMNKDILPYPIRIEKDVNWVHVDMRNDGSRCKIEYFNG